MSFINENSYLRYRCLYQIQQTGVVLHLKMEWKFKRDNIIWFKMIMIKF